MPSGYWKDSDRHTPVRWVRKRLVLGGFGFLFLLPTVHAQAPATEAPNAQATVAPPQSVVGPDYVIGPGDVLDIFVWRNPELSTHVPVRPDGKISTPLVEDISAVGKTTSQLAREMEAVLGRFIRTPNVNVIVSQAVSAKSQIVVVGQAANPKALPYREGLNVMDVMIAVGGLAEFAAGNRAKIVRRDANGGTTEIRVRLKALMEGGDLSQNLPLKPGDVIVIPESFF